MRNPYKHLKVKTNYSKSLLHRALFAALLTDGVTTIKHINLCDDVLATIDCLRACNVKVVVNEMEDMIVVDATNRCAPQTIIDLNQSGTTMRFSIPILIGLFEQITFSGKPTLLSRPLDVYDQLFTNIRGDKNVTIKGGYDQRTYVIDGKNSSQFISGLIMILPLLEFDTTLILKNVVSKSYILMTIAVLRLFNVEVIYGENIIFVKGKQKYQPNVTYINEVDESSLSYIRALNFVGSDIEYESNQTTLQPDHVLVKILDEQPSIIDATDCPDLVPTLIFVCQFFNHSTTITHVDRLRIKESDRLSAILEVGNMLGLDLVYQSDELQITPVDNFNACSVNSYDDHRIAMMEILFSTQAAITIDDISVINKSYPQFYEALLKLEEKE